MVFFMAKKSRSKSKSGAKAKSSIKTAPPAKKKLARSKSNRMLLGVMGGIAEYFNMDPMHVRLAWWAFVVITALAAGAIAYALVPTVLTLLGVAYLVAFLLMNEAPAK